MTFSIRRLLVLFAVMTLAFVTLLASGTGLRFWSDNDADLPSFGKGGEIEVDKEEYMMRRAEGIAQKRGISEGARFDPQARPAALREMEIQEHHVANMPRSLAKDALLAPWIALGPNPIPNGQFGPVSGRTISIAVHPTNPNIVYVGAALNWPTTN